MEDWLIDKGTIDRYLNAVVKATEDEEYFKIFKSEIEYCSVVGMSDEWQLPYFLEYFNRYNFQNKLEQVAKNDSIGGRPTVEFNDQKISLNTARYLHTTCEIYKYFGPLDGKTISEIGVGYGGLCYVLNCLFKINNYHLLDLPEVQILARKYLDRLNVENISSHRAGRSFLTISEYAITELDGDLIEKYYENTLLKSDNIYIRVNIHNKMEKDGFIKFISRGFDVKVYDEYPKHPDYDNKLVIGTKKKKKENL